MEAYLDYEIDPDLNKEAETLEAEKSEGFIKNAVAKAEAAVNENVGNDLWSTIIKGV